MASLNLLYQSRPVEEVAILVTRASLLAKEKPELTLYERQNALRLGYGEATVLYDWLADTHVAAGHISTHWIRCGRAYVLNNPCPNLVEMGTMLNIGERRPFLLMLALEQKGAIRIKEDFSFERRIRMASFDDLVRQMQRVAKKYRGRCEPKLLIRTLYIEASASSSVTTMLG